MEHRAATRSQSCSISNQPHERRLRNYKCRIGQSTLKPKKPGAQADQLRTIREPKKSGQIFLEPSTLAPANTLASKPMSSGQMLYIATSR